MAFRPGATFLLSRVRLQRVPRGAAAPEPAPAAAAPRHRARQRPAAAGLRAGRAPAEALAAVAHLHQAHALQEVSAAAAPAPGTPLACFCAWGPVLGTDGGQKDWDSPSVVVDAGSLRGLSRGARDLGTSGTLQSVGDKRAGHPAQAQSAERKRAAGARLRLL